MKTPAVFDALSILFHSILMSACAKLYLCEKHCPLVPCMNARRLLKYVCVCMCMCMCICPNVSMCVCVCICVCGCVRVCVSGICVSMARVGVWLGITGAQSCCSTSLITTAVWGHMGWGRGGGVAQGVGGTGGF